jgi:hypothetical protein
MKGLDERNRKSLLSIVGKHIGRLRWTWENNMKLQWALIYLTTLLELHRSQG